MARRGGEGRRVRVGREDVRISCVTLLCFSRSASRCASSKQRNLARRVLSSCRREARFTKHSVEAVMGG